MKQFTTHCKFCGSLIVMTYSERNNKWIPCEPEILRFRKNNGLSTFVNPEGEICRGEQIGRSYADGYAEYGYRLHQRDCANVRRNAV